MTDLWVILMASAATVVFTRGKLFQWLRDHGPRLWRELVGCPLCLGVWVGAGVHLAEHHEGSWDLRSVLHLVGIAALSGVAAMAIFLVLDVLRDAGEAAQAVRDMADRELGPEGQDQGPK